MDRACAKCSHAFNLSVLSPHNENLTTAQKGLLLDHQRLGHIGIDHLCTLYHCPTMSIAPTSIVEADCTACIVPRHPQVLTCLPLACLACNVAKARKLPHSTGRSLHAELGEQHTLSQNILQPGECIFINQYESSIRGHLPTTQGLKSPSQQYCGGTLFFDIASQFIFIHHKVSLGATDTLMSKSQFECEAAHCGVTVDHYHTDNGIFTKSQFRDALLLANQGHTVSGIGTHHQNGLAERTIKTIQDMICTMLIRLSIHWPDEYDVQLWPFAMDYAMWLYNHMPWHDSSLAPIELFCGMCLNCEYLPAPRCLAV